MGIKTETTYTCDKCLREDSDAKYFRALHVSGLEKDYEHSETVIWCHDCLETAGLQVLFAATEAGISYLERAKEAS